MTAITGIVGVSHRFAERGLGTEPYTIMSHDPPWAGLSSCDYCGTGIREKFYLRSSDGRQFKVGNECIMRAGDNGLVSIARRMHAAIQRQQRLEREKRQLADLQTVMESSALRQGLMELPHPYAYRAERGETALDYMQYLTRPWASGQSIREARKFLKSEAVLDLIQRERVA